MNKECKIKGWVARDSDGSLTLCKVKPSRYENDCWIGAEEYFPLNRTLFPELTWESEPIEVELTFQKVVKQELKELTWFEKAIYQHICIIVTACDGNVYGDKELKPIVKGIAKELLDLARKQIEKDIEEGAVEFAKSYMEDVNPSFEKVQESEELWKWKMSCLRGINKAYKQGKQDALKDLPKWKRATEHKDLEINEACILDDDIYPIIATNVNIGEYYLELDELKNLPLEK